MSLISAVLFLIIAPSLALYSQGYRLDFEKKKISRTGGIFFKIAPKQTEIYINGELAEKTDFFFGSALIENLLPKTYKVEIKKAGFKTWEKTLEVKEQEVTSAKNVILFAENYALNTAAKNVENFWLTPERKKFVLKDTEKNIWSLKLYEPEKNLTSLIIDEHDLPGQNIEIIDLEFSPDFKEIYLKIASGEQIKYYLVSTDKTHLPQALRNPPLFWQDNVLSYYISGNTIFYLDNAGDIFKTDFNLSPKEKVSEIPFRIKPETNYKIWIFGNSIFLAEDKTLYQYNPQTRLFEKIIDSVIDVKLSSDEKKIAFFNDNETWVMFLADIEDQPTKKAGDKILLGRFSEKIENISWLNSHYLIFNSGALIKISEIDDRDKINVVDIISKQNPRIFWDQTAKQLYILSEKNLFQSEKIIK